MSWLWRSGCLMCVLGDFVCGVEIDFFSFL